MKQQKPKSENSAFINEQIQNCSLCSLCKLRNSSVLIQNKKADILFVSLFYEPNFLDFVRSCEHFAQFDEKYIYSSVLRCEPKKNSLNIFLKNHDIFASVQFCKYYLKHEIDAICPKVIVALGSEVFYTFTGEQEQAFSTLRGGVYRLENSLILPTFSKEQVLKSPSLKDDFYADLSKIKGLL